MPAVKPKTRPIHFLLIAAFSIIAMLPSYYSGVPSGNDQGQHYQFAWTVYNSVRSGEIYPGLAGDTNHGFGDYGLRFYPPLTYYALSAAYVATQDWYFASFLAFTLVFFVGGLGIYLWARQEFDPSQALIAAMLYTFAAYHLNQIYNNFLLAEFFATAILPFCFLFVMRVCRNGRWSDAIGLAIAYSLLFLTHLPLALIGSIAMAFYALFMLRETGLLLRLSKLIIAGLSAVVMTAFYWSRWLPEMAWITHSLPKYFATTWDYRSNFLLVPDHFLKFGEDVLNLWFADLMLVVMLLVAIPSVVYFAKNRTSLSRQMLAVFAVLVFAVFMTTPLSSPIWDNAGFLQKVQFPWRWLAIVSAFGAFFASAGIFKASEAMKTGRNILLPVGLGAILIVFFFAAAFVPKGSVYIARDELNQRITDIPNSEGCDCWWPVWARRSAFNRMEKVATGGRTVELLSWKTADKQFHVNAGEPIAATVAVFYYPRWQATVNGTDTPVDSNEDGIISIAVPADAVDIRLVFREPAYVRAANYASLAVWFFAFVFSAILLIKSRRDAARAVS